MNILRSVTLALLREWVVDIVGVRGLTVWYALAERRDLKIDVVVQRE